MFEELTDQELSERVAAGIVWLVAHDPTGAFHFWFSEAKLTDRSPMPAQKGRHGAPGPFSTPLVVDEWRRYYKQRQIWEQLDAEDRRRLGL